MCAHEERFKKMQGVHGETPCLFAPDSAGEHHQSDVNDSNVPPQVIFEQGEEPGESAFQRTAADEALKFWPWVNQVCGEIFSARANRRGRGS